MEDPKVLTILELVQRGSPLTATSSLHSPPRSRPISPKPSASNQRPKPPGPTPSNPNPNPTVLTPLNHPAILIGTLNLPTADSTSAPNLNPRCPYRTCFQFSDTSATICCDILDLDVRIIGKKIRVLAWNFVPLKKHGGGFLEIIKWRFSESIGRLGRCSVDSFPLVSSSESSFEDSSKARYRIHGALESVSPVIVVPCNKGLNSSYSANLRGFLVQFIVCECEMCSSKTSLMVLNDSIIEHGQGSGCHCYNKPEFVYFCGSTSSWHPVITKLIGNVITVSGLKKKLVYIGKEESRLMYVTTDKSALHLPRLSKKWVPHEKGIVKGKGECGSYKGVVRGVYMQGMVVELDDEVWLLLTDHQVTAPHSLRVGALISVRNVHFVNPKFSWKKMVILGACFKTSIIVESFSPLETGCHVVSQSQSMLGKFVESLVYSARLWVLLVVSCFRKKFAGITSEKEILGSKHKEGLVQVYATFHLPMLVFRSRHGVFMELCKHDQCGCGSELNSDSLKLVMPISSFIRYCEATWTRMLRLEKDCKKMFEKNQFSLLPCEGRFYGRSVRKILTSQDIGIILLGSLKISPTSGRLQLVDATGSIDVLIPDLPSTWNANSIFEVINYSVVVEGVPNMIDHLGLSDSESVSCRSIFQCISLARETNLAVFVYFHFRNVACRNIPLNQCIDWKNDIKKLEDGTFHLLYITHKFPVPQKFQGDLAVSNTSSLFVEVLILPWNLFLAPDGLMNPTTVSREQLEKPMEHSAGENYQECVSLRRCNFNHSPIRELRSGIMYDFHKSGCENPYTQSRKKPKLCNLSSYEISCLVTVRGVDGNDLVTSGILYCTRANLGSSGGCRSGAYKVLMEFKSESFFNYQLLQIGGYYITKHHGDDHFCNFEDSVYASGVKVLITSGTHFWSLSYASNEDLRNSNSSHHPILDDSSFRNNEVLSEDQIELLQVSTENSARTCLDVHLCLPAPVIGLLEVNLEGLGEGLVKPVVIPKDISNASLPMGSPDCNRLFPEGNLSSLRGQVVAVHGIDDSSIDAHLSHKSLGDVCILVLVDDRSVTIFGSLNKHAFPTGFGPGTYATFHRILELGRKNIFMLTPVTFIAINSIHVVSEPYRDTYFKFWPASDAYNNASPDSVSSGLFSDLFQRLDCKPMRFHCRVVAVRILVLEKKKVIYDDLQSKVLARPPLIDIPLACFVLDDGSSSCCCWADAERAATLLRLHEKLPRRERSGWTLKWAGIDDNACSTSTYYLERIFKDHDRITVKNYGSMFDSSYQELAVSYTPDNALSISDESLLKFITLNASFGPFWTVVASMMDSSTCWQLEKEHLTEMEMPVHAIPNIWASEVCYTNPLTDGRDMIQELLNR
ncbi:CST complex subunit CTC1 isoform X2 [Corylus avellana]|uniref:CST complex subunit CTC1 isoform X2 n=1 Tax=Corylus avellana TaxID=13451 RepID=UPI00286D2ADB|nr:CST complex subunit CTC1 isoform X2 [Corylus avellana]